MNAEAITLPHHLAVFLEAISPIKSRLPLAMMRQIEPSVVPAVFHERLSELLHSLSIQVEKLTVISNEQLGVVVQSRDASDVSVFAAVNAFELCLNNMVLTFYSVCALKASR